MVCLFITHAEVLTLISLPGIDWLGKHIWTYVGLAAPLLGAPGPLRSVLSGENMGLPFTDEEARILELCKSTGYLYCLL